MRWQSGGGHGHNRNGNNYFAFNPNKTYFTTLGGNFITPLAGGHLSIGTYFTGDGKDWGLLFTLGEGVGYDASVDLSCGSINGASSDLKEWYQVNSAGRGLLGYSRLNGENGNYMGDAFGLSLGFPYSGSSMFTYTWTKSMK